MFIIDFIVTFGFIALVILTLGTLVYLAPKAIDFVKSVIKWHSNREENYDDDFM